MPPRPDVREAPAHPGTAGHPVPPPRAGAAHPPAPASGRSGRAAASRTRGARTDPGGGAATDTRLVTGAASTVVRTVLDGPCRDARVLAAFPLACYLELPGATEPRVVALVTTRAVRLPNSLVVPDTTPLDRVRPGMTARVGAGTVRVGPVLAGVARWWDPVPALSPISPVHLDLRRARLDALRAASAKRPGLVPADGPGRLADACAADALADAVEQAERIVGLGPGLTPAGDDVLCGLLLALRHLGPAATAPRDAAAERRPAEAPGAAVRLADWIGAAVTSDATTRTTALSATLLHCAAAGQASGEVAGVLRELTARDGRGLGPAVGRLLATGHTSGADLAWGLAAGARAAALAGTGRHTA